MESGIADLTKEHKEELQKVTLDLSCRTLATYPVDKLNAIKNLTCLNVSCNRLAGFPFELTLYSLTSLDLSKNRIKHFPAHLCNLTRLKSLFLSRNKLETVHENITNLVELERLHLDMNSLLTLPQSLSKLTNLVSLNVFGNRITSLEGELLGNLHKLEHLDIGSNAISSIPSEIGNCTSLKTLLCYKNQISQLPDEFSNLQQLERLYLRWNKLTTFPLVLIKLDALQVLDLSGNSIRKFPFVERDKVEVTSQTQPKSNMRIRIVTEDGVAVDNQQVEGSKDDVNDVDDEAVLKYGKDSSVYSEWKSLKKLNLIANQLTNIPMELISLKSIEFIALSKNPLTTQWKEYSSLSLQTYLQKLNLLKPMEVNIESKTSPPQNKPFGFLDKVLHSKEKKSLLSKEQLIDKIKGCIFGNAIGDAIGLSTEFLFKEQGVFYYGGTDITYDSIINDQHRSPFTLGDWTDDTDQMILILDSIVENNGKIVETDFASRLKHWIKHGFVELSDENGSGCGQTIRTTANSPEFLLNPQKTAEKMWINSNKQSASNGAVMRTSILGIIPNFSNINQVIENTKKICKCTHADPRCIASCVAVTSAISLMLSGEFGDVDDEEKMKNFLERVFHYSQKEVEDAEELKWLLCQSNFDSLQLDESDKMGYTYKTLGAAFAAFRMGSDFKKIISQLVLHAGDADTNAAVAGALLGCKIGYSKMPEEWVDRLKHRDWLSNKVSKVLRLLNLSKYEADDEAKKLEKRNRYMCGQDFYTIEDLTPWCQRLKSSSSETHEYHSHNDGINCKVCLWKGDITALEIDAIVCSSSPNFQGGGGVEARVHEAAGPQLDVECKTIGSCSPGNAVLTNGYNLPAKYVIHAVGPSNQESKVLESCYLKSLELVSEHNIRSVALTCVSTGTGAFPLEESCHIALKTVRNWLEDSKHREKIRLIVFNVFEEEQLQMYEKLMCHYFPQ